jgi:hypothetical protein
MQHQASAGTRSNLVFADTIPTSQREKLFGRIIQDAVRERRGEFLYRNPDEFDDYDEYTLSQDEEEAPNELLQTASESLADIGFADPVSLLPSREQIVFKERSELAEEAMAGCNKFGQFITVAVPYGATLHYLKSYKAFFQAVALFVYTRVISKADPNYSLSYLVERGYELKAIGFDERSEEGEFRGMYRGALADLFALFSLHTFTKYSRHHTEVSTVYDNGVAFLVALITTYAQQTGTEPLAVFKRLFKAHALRDFSMQHELAGVFGSETIAAINRLETGTSISPDSKSWKQAAEQGNFLKKYLSLREKIHSGGLLPFPGIQGGLRLWSEWYA